MAHVAEIDNIIQPEAKIWNRLVVFFQKVSCQVICEEHSPNRFTALVIMPSSSAEHGAVRLPRRGRGRGGHCGQVTQDTGG